MGLTGTGFIRCQKHGAQLSRFCPQHECGDDATSVPDATRCNDRGAYGISHLGNERQRARQRPVG